MDPQVWDATYIPPCLKEALTELSPPIAPPLMEELFMLAQMKRKRCLIIPPNEPMSSLKIAHKRTRYQSTFPLQESARSASPLPLATHPLSNVLSMLPSTVSMLPQAPPQMVLSSKKTLQMSKKSCPSPLSLGTQTMDLRLRTPKPLVSWSDFVSYGATILSESSFMACCSHSHTKVLHIQSTPSQSLPYLYPRMLQTHPLLDQFPWHPNRILLSDVVPMVDIDTDDQQEAWGCLYIKFRDLFHSQLSWCLTARLDSLTRCLHSDSTETEGLTISPA